MEVLFGGICLERGLSCIGGRYAGPAVHKNLRLGSGFRVLWGVSSVMNAWVKNASEPPYAAFV